MLICSVTTPVQAGHTAERTNPAVLHWQGPAPLQADEELVTSLLGSLDSPALTTTFTTSQHNTGQHC